MNLVSAVGEEDVGLFAIQLSISKSFTILRPISLSLWWKGLILYAMFILLLLKHFILTQCLLVLLLHVKLEWILLDYSPDCSYLTLLFQLISATDRHRQCTDHPIKFILRRAPYSLKFKIKPGKDLCSVILTKLTVMKNICRWNLFLVMYPNFKIQWTGSEAGNVDARTKKVSSFLFHPFLPLALSVQQTLFLQPSVVNIHFRRWAWFLQFDWSLQKSSSAMTVHL